MAQVVEERYEGMASPDDGYESADIEETEDEFDDSQYGTMARFVPTLVLERLRAFGKAAAAPKRSVSGSLDSGHIAANAEEEIDAPKAHELDAAVMVVDVSGFSGMCERFAQGFVPDGGWRQRMKGVTSLNASPAGGGGRAGGGSSGGVRRSGAFDASVITSFYRLSNDKETKGFGAEGVRDALNLALGALISTVERHGGDVLRIAGDALIVLFHQGRTGISEFELANLCVACTRCGWDCTASVAADGGSGGGGLSVHVGVGCGRVSCFHVGSDRLGWQLVVSGGLFEEQVAKALDASRAGEVVVSAQVWQHLTETGWSSSPVQPKDSESSFSAGLRLLHWTPEPGGAGIGTGWWDDDVHQTRTSRMSGSYGIADHQPSGQRRREEDNGDASLISPAHGGAGALAGGGGSGPNGGSSAAALAAAMPRSPPQGPQRPGTIRRSSYSGLMRVSSAASSSSGTASGLGEGGPGRSHGRAVSLDYAPGVGGAGGVTPGGRWCPSRRRLSLLEEVETGVLTMLSKEVGRALRGYCPQSIREGLVAERLGLLAELQRVAVLFVGLSFEGVECDMQSVVKPIGRKSTGSSNAQAPPQVFTEPAAASTAEAAAAAAAAAGGRVSGAKQKEGGEGVESSGIRCNPVDGGHAEVKVGAGKPPTKNDKRAAVLSLELLQGSFSLLQSIVANHGGMIKELSVDDKGTVLVVGFGLSPRVGHLPAARATLCAMECTDRLRAKGLARCHAGVATGPVFCGSLGSEDRREFAMISETVNLAQRLMSARKSNRLLPKGQANRTASVRSKSSPKGREGPAQRGIPPSRVVDDSRIAPTENTSASPGGAVVRTVGRGFDGIVKGLMPPGKKKLAAKSGVAGRKQGREGQVLPLTPVGTPLSNRKKLPDGGGGGGQGDLWGVWEESFNRWVVLEEETLQEARKTEQLAFLPLEAIKVKGKTSKVDVFSPALSIDVVPAFSTLPLSPVRPTRTDLAHHVAAGSPGATRSGAGGAAAPSPCPPSGIILGGCGGGRGSGRTPPPPPLPPPPPSRSSFPVSQPSHGLSTVERPSMRVGALAGGDDVGSTDKSALTSETVLDDSKRYQLESPRKGHWEGGGRRGSGHSLDGDPKFPDPVDGARADPLPDAAAKRFASWGNLRDAHAGGAAAGGAASAAGVAPDRVEGGMSNREGSDGGGDVWGQSERGGDVLNREAFEALLPCIFHADIVHDEVSHILWARTRGRVFYLADLCRSLLGVSRGSSTSVGDVGEDGTWRLRLNEFAHVLKLASKVPPGVEGALHSRLDELPYNARQVVLRVVCVTVVAGLGETDLLLHLLTNVAPFKEYWKAVVSEYESGDTPTRRRGSRSSRRTSVSSRRSSTTSPVHASARSAVENALGDAVGNARASAGGGSRTTRRQRAGSVEGRLTTATGEGRAPSQGQRSMHAEPTEVAVAAVAAAPLAKLFEHQEEDGKEQRERTRSDFTPGAVSAGAQRALGSGAGMPVPRGESGVRVTSPLSPKASVVLPSAVAAATDKLTNPCSRARVGAGEEALRSCLSMLEAGGFLRVCEGGKAFICDDVMLMDQVYASTPFKLRKSLHKEAAQWISDRHRRDFRDRAEVMPILIHHLTQAHEEARAQAMLAVLKVIGGRFLDKWVLEHVRPLVAIREYPHNPIASEHLALCVLPALPSLRGLSKAIRGAEIAGVVVGVARRLRSLRLKDVDKRLFLRQRRSLSISGSFKIGSGASSPTFRAVTVGDDQLMRRSVSLAGGPPPTTSEWELPPRITVKRTEQMEIMVGDKISRSNAVDSRGEPLNLDHRA